MKLVDVKFGGKVEENAMLSGDWRWGRQSTSLHADFQLSKTGRLVEAVHEIEILNRDARRTFDQIVGR